jgi:WhiB family redox-sensing transcriptional regulator
MTTFLDDVTDAVFVRDSEDWRNGAACRNEDPELFWPVGHSTAALAQRASAKAVCYGCPVIAECRDAAFAHGDYEGVWGGLDEDERRAMRRRAAPAPAPVPTRHPRTNMRWPKRDDT